MPFPIDGKEVYIIDVGAEDMMPNRQDCSLDEAIRSYRRVHWSSWGHWGRARIHTSLHPILHSIKMKGINPSNA